MPHKAKKVIRKISGMECNNTPYKKGQKRFPRYLPPQCVKNLNALRELACSSYMRMADGHCIMQLEAVMPPTKGTWKTFLQMGDPAQDGKESIRVLNITKIWEYLNATQVNPIPCPSKDFSVFFTSKMLQLFELVHRIQMFWTLEDMKECDCLKKMLQLPLSQIIVRVYKYISCGSTNIRSLSSAQSVDENIEFLVSEVMRLYNDKLRRV